MHPALDVDDVVLLLFRFLDPRTRGRLARVCRRFAYLSRDAPWFSPICPLVWVTERNAHIRFDASVSVVQRVTFLPDRLSLRSLIYPWVTHLTIDATPCRGIEGFEFPFPAGLQSLTLVQFCPPRPSDVIPFFRRLDLPQRVTWVLRSVRPVDPASFEGLFSSVVELTLVGDFSFAHLDHLSSSVRRLTLQNEFRRSVEVSSSWPCIPSSVTSVSINYPLCVFSGSAGPWTVGKHVHLEVRCASGREWLRVIGH